MTRSLAESLLIALLATNAGLLAFIAGVLRKVMNDMDDSQFKQFVTSLVHHSKKSPFMIAILNVPLFAAIPYFYKYRFENRWLFAALAIWLIAGTIGKIMKLPVYKAIEMRDGIKLREQRAKLNVANTLQALLNSLAVVLAIFPLVS
jgi:hypothetical protein